MAKAPEKVKEIVQRSQVQVEALRGPRVRLRQEENDTSGPVIAMKVYCNVYSTGPRASLVAMPLHEIPLARKKIEVLGQELHIDPSWPEGMARERPMTAADMVNEFERLRLIYVFSNGDAETSKYDLLSDMYGRLNSGALKGAIRRQYDAWKKLAGKGDDLTEAMFEDLAALAFGEESLEDSQFEA